MSETDKTGDKLVASIRKTKAGAAKPAQAAPARSAKPTTRARARKPAPKSRRTATATGNVDPYSCGGRVWPD